MNREPLFNASVMVAIVAAGIVLLVSFGLPVSPDQTEAIIGFVTIIAPLVVAVLARNKVTPLADPRNSAGDELVVADADTHIH